MNQSSASGSLRSKAGCCASCNGGARSHRSSRRIDRDNSRWGRGRQRIFSATDPWGRLNTGTRTAHRDVGTCCCSWRGRRVLQNNGPRLGSVRNDLKGRASGRWALVFVLFSLSFTLGWRRADGEDFLQNGRVFLSLGSSLHHGNNRSGGRNAEGSRVAVV